MKKVKENLTRRIFVARTARLSTSARAKRAAPHEVKERGANHIAPRHLKARAIARSSPSRSPSRANAGVRSAAGERCASLDDLLVEPDTLRPPVHIGAHIDFIREAPHDLAA